VRFTQFESLFGRNPSPARRSLSSRPLRLEALEERWVPSTLTVGSGKQYATIGAALTAASPGDTINVYPGTYNEQLTIAKSGIKLVAQPTTSTSNDVIITDPGVSGSVSGAVGGALIDITVSNTKVTGFQINGTSNDSNLFADVRVRNGGSATISNNTILGPVNPSNAAYGIGIQVGDSQVSGAAGAGIAKINGNNISGYFGEGIMVDGSGGNASIGTGGANTIAGSTTSAVAAYGVQVSRGGSARVQNNTISNNVNTAGNSGGIFFFQVSSANNVAAKNTISNSSYGILVQSSTGSNYGIQVVQNTVIGSSFAGIDVLSSSNVEVENNSVSGSVITAQNPGANGIALGFSSDVEVENNVTFGNQSDGIYDFQGSGNLIQCNTSYNNGTSTVVGNGINIQDSVNDNLFLNTTYGNMAEGIQVFSDGSGPTSNNINIWLGNSTNNTLDGIFLSGTTNVTVVGNALGANGGYGLRLNQTTNTFIALNLIPGNGQGSIFIDSASTGVTAMDNWTSTPPTVQGTAGASGTSNAFTSSSAAADAFVAGLNDL
jgi:parallel beta-helix repeat protein